MIPQEGESTHRRGFLETIRGEDRSITLVQGQFWGTNDRKALFSSPEGEGLRWAADIIDTLAKQYGFRARVNARGQGFLGADENGLVFDAVDYNITLKQPLIGTREPTSSRLIKLYGDLLVTGENFELYHLEGLEFPNPPPALGEKFVDQAIETLEGKLIEGGVLSPVQM